MNYQEAIEWLYSTQLHGIRLGLEPVERLLKSLGVHTSGKSAPKFVHVAGTNGKGSVCAFIDSILRADGRRVGLYTSPHLVTFRERIRVNGEMISEEAVAELLSEIRNITASWEHTPTFFEITTALALAHFQREKAEVVVLETGMGGRLDATNVVTPIVSVITPIYLDHQQWLGESLPEIALEKAGIIKPEVPVVCAWQREEVLRVLGHVALHRDAPFHLVLSPLGAVEIGLKGKHQRWNAAIAVHAINIAFPRVSEEAIAKGLRDVEWPGRFHEVQKGLILDGAHNPAASRRLVETWKEVQGDKRATLIIGAAQDKDMSGIWDALRPIAARVILVPLQSPRSASPSDLEKVILSASPDMPCSPCETLEAALDTARTYSDPILVTGSLFLVGETLALLQQQPQPLVSTQ